MDIQPLARPRRLRDSIAGFVTAHGLLFSADRSRSWNSLGVLKLDSWSRQILQQHFCRSIDWYVLEETTWRTTQSRPPWIGPTFSKAFQIFIYSGCCQHASTCLAVTMTDLTWGNQFWRSNRCSFSMQIVSWEVWGSKHSWHLLGSRGFGSLQKSKLKKLWNVWAMLGVGYFWADSQPVGRNVRDEIWVWTCLTSKVARCTAAIELR